MHKRGITLLALALLLAVALSALGTGVTLTLRGEDPVTAQAAAFQAYLDQLSPADQAAWHQQLGQLLARAEGAVPLTLFDEPEGEEGLVYIVASGKVYHHSQHCNTLSRSKNIRGISLEEAIGMGRRPCKVCGGH